MRIADAPAHERDLELTVVDVRELRRADRSAEGDLDPELVQGIPGVVRRAGPVGEVAREVELVGEGLAALRVDAVAALGVAGVGHELGRRGDVVVVGLQLPLIGGADPQRHDVVAHSAHELRRLCRVAVCDLRRLRLVDGHRHRLPEALVLELRRAGPVEDDRWSGVERATDDADALIAERLVRREREAVGRVVDVTGEHERRHRVGLALVHHDLVEVDLVDEQATGVLHHRELRGGDRRLVDLVRPDRCGAVRPEVRDLLGDGLHLVGRGRLARAVEVLELLRERAELGVRTDRVAEHEARDERGRSADVEAHRVLVRGLELVRVRPDAEALRAADPVRRRDVGGGELLAVVPLEPLLQLDLVVLTVLGG